jgi:hypothetical protein
MILEIHFEHSFRTHEFANATDTVLALKLNSLSFASCYSLLRVVTLDNGFPLRIRPTPPLHLSLEAAVRKASTTGYPVVSLIWSVHRVGDLLFPRRPSRLPVTTNLSRLPPPRRAMWPKNWTMRRRHVRETICDSKFS